MKAKNTFTYPLRVHIEDTDCTRLVYHSRYLNFMERARSEWLIQLGFNSDWQKDQGLFFVVKNINIAYLKPAALHDELQIISEIKELRAASLVFRQYLRLSELPDKLLCEAEVKIACVNEDMRPCPLPEILKQSLKHFIL